MTDYSQIKLIALDLDETTLNSEGELSPRTRAAIEDAISAGIHIVIASGRAYTTLPKEVLAIDGIDYAITSNGAAMYHVPDNRCIRSYKLLSASVEAIIALKARYDITFECFIDGKAYAYSTYIDDPERFGVNIKAKAYLTATRTPVDDIEGFMLENSSRLDSIDIVVKNIEARNEITELLRRNDSEAFVTSSVGSLVEVAYKKAGKGSGLSFIAGLLGVPLELCAAFGNADNDVDMLKKSGMGVAVANATAACLESADIITDSHKADGIAKIIEQILLSK